MELASIQCKDYFLVTIQKKHILNVGLGERTSSNTRKNLYPKSHMVQTLDRNGIVQEY